ncbi:hypothetical protein AX766_05510 [Flavobacterium covae]|uniref:hypothetical protein n=1 Tax=Flavobacterium TaxID=237 RepID=UPI0007C1B13A|nr:MULTISPECIES: hypothetical protein [Flavobacterium]AND63912.1 hypothetical protein AX766_05510 [Flavobacterium covae]MEB3800087.1 hypothetical protein [Flavobacterium columnare]OXA73972.1 hypothetical protein B0A56_13045 [Flavobacterium columnare NBRC 100251 = ATCC 23463]
MKLFLLLLSFYFQKSNRLNGRYEVTTEVIGDKKNIQLTYFLSFRSQKMIVSIKSKDVMDYWCEGVYILKKRGDIFQGTGPCSDENPDNDIFIKKVRNKIFIRSKSFVNKDWLEVTEFIRK